MRTTTTVTLVQIDSSAAGISGRVFGHNLPSTHGGLRSFAGARAAAHAQSGDESLEQVRQFMRALHGNLVVAFEADTAGARETSGQSCHRLRVEIAVPSAPDDQCRHCQRLNTVGE